MDLFNPLSDPQFNVQSVAYTGTAGTTTGWPSGPQGVLIWSDQPCYVIVGDGVTATATNGTPIPSYTPIAFKINTNGGKWRVSAIQIATGGTIFCKPVNIQ